MNMSEKVLVPDIGEATDVEVIEILVAVGDEVESDQSLVVLESDKASMEIPAPASGRVTMIQVTLGDPVAEGDLLLELETAAEKAAPSGEDAQTEAEPQTGRDAPVESESEKTITETSESESAEQISSAEIIIVVPDVGEADEIEVTEILVAIGDQIGKEQSICVLESDKASMEIPSSHAGEVLEIMCASGDSVKEGSALIRLKVLQATIPSDSAVPEAIVESPVKPEAEVVRTVTTSLPVIAEKTSTESAATQTEAKAHAGPAVRKQARELGVNLEEVKGSGRNGRVIKEDVQEYVKDRLKHTSSQSEGGGIPTVPEIDFTRFGETEVKPFSRVRRASAKNLHRSWLNVPHVTQFDQADITELESFRKQQNKMLTDDGVKLTPLAFLVMAVVNALKAFPNFNASLQPDGGGLILKRYYHVGIAVDTDDGLVVPVIKNADTMSLSKIALACGELAEAARNQKLKMDAMQGACFTISSLGGIGGTAFTPIVNAPEVAILGVSRSEIKPVYQDGNFEPRLMLPLSLSYDHRAIDGAEAARFTSYLTSMLQDIRRLLV